MLDTLREARNKADYHIDRTFSYDAAKDYVDDAEDLIGEISTAGVKNLVAVWMDQLAI